MDEQKSEPPKKRATLIKVAGISSGVILITVGMLSAPRIGNYLMLFTLFGISVAVFAFVSASSRSSL